MLVNVIPNRTSRDYTHPEEHTSPTYILTKSVLFLSFYKFVEQHTASSTGERVWGWGEAGVETKKNCAKM